MAGISSLGVGSGVLNSDLVDSLVSAEKKPVESRLAFETQRTEAILSAYGKLRSAITELRLPMRQLSSPDAMRSFAATSSNDDVAVTLDSKNASRGTYSVSVGTLAASQSLASTVFADKDTTSIGTGELTITTGDTTKTLTVDGSNNSLQGLATAINELNMGVSAGVVDTGSGYRLVMSSDKTGTANEIQITATDSDGNNTDAAGLSQFVFDGTTSNLEETVPASDATMTINGIAITRSSNTIEGVIDGLTFDLKAANATSTIKVTQDTGAVADKVQAFVDKFNGLQSTIKSLAGFNAETQQGGLLTGDSTVRGIQNQLRGILGQVVPGLENADVRSLADVGITTNFETGGLNFDRTKFISKLESNPDDLTALFAEQGRASDPQVEFVRSSTKTQPGDYAINVTQMATQGAYTGTDISASTSFSIVDGSNTFSLNVDGTTSATISLTAATYGSRDAMLAEINSQLQANSALKSAGKTVTATYDAAAGGFVFTSGTFGSESNVSVTAADADVTSNLGLAVQTGTAGVDVAGTINGRAAKGDGQVLYMDATSTGPESGLQVRITGGGTGDRGTLTFIEGVGEKVVNLVSGLLDDGGALIKRSDSLQDKLDDIADQRVRLEERMASYRERLVAQFTAADSLIAQLNSTRDYVSQQLEALAPQNFNKK